MQVNIAIIDYGAGNIGSVLNMYKKVGLKASAARMPDDITAATHVILPGVGAYDYCAKQLMASNLLSAFKQAALEDKKPVLGICVGFQLLFSRSEEGGYPGLAWLKGKVVKFDSDKLSSTQKVPHMGWESISHQGHPLFAGMNDPRFYFVHSYHAQPEQAQDSIATCDYGYRFCAAAAQGNIMGVQFHPEKSHRFGMALLKNFAAI
ncbi:MAG: imidazole glycerol phosphate synthase subunit HisH [Rickettsiales bacterium]|nr:imidazole glycerol phosphate synthase subunit HisH [Rickettsiales bacterium]